MLPRFLRNCVAVLLLLASSCASTSEPPTGDLNLDLNHRDPLVRAGAAVLAAEENRIDLFPQLLKNLRHPNGEVRLFTGAAIRKLTGQDFDYNPSACPQDQDAAIARYQRWWETRQTAPPGPAAPTAIPGSKPPAQGPPAASLQTSAEPLQTFRPERASASGAGSADRAVEEHP